MPAPITGPASYQPLPPRSHHPNATAPSSLRRRPASAAARGRPVRQSRAGSVWVRRAGDPGWGPCSAIGEMRRLRSARHGGAGRIAVAGREVVLKLCISDVRTFACVLR
jgi:hypothetical protein